MPTADEYRKATGESFAGLWAIARRREVVFVGICCRLQRSINEIVAAQAVIQQDLDILWGLSPCPRRTNRRARRVDNLSEEQDALGKKAAAVWNVLVVKHKSLQRWTARRQIVEKAIIKEIVEKARKGEELGADDAALLSKFPRGEDEYVVHGDQHGLKDCFEVDERLDSSRSVAARWEESCLSWLHE